MNNSLIVITILIFSLILLSSCDGECKNERIEKVEWVTNYEDQTKDILVNYTITENKTEQNDENTELIHTITIKSNDDNYSNKFAITINYGFLTEKKERKYSSYNSDYVEILPGKTHTFTFDRQSKYFYNFNSNVIIKQKPYTLSYKKRIDELKTENIYVDSCVVNIESLKEKYKTIRELYNLRNLNDEKSK